LRTSPGISQKKPATSLIFDLDDTLASDVRAIDQAFELTARVIPEPHNINGALLTEIVKRHARGIWRTFDPAREYVLKIGISSWEGLWAEFDGDDQ
jgi:putative hydrolase of the HAD superfamily